MAKRLQHRGGTTSQHSTFTGAVREVTVDTDKNTLVVHDGATAGGYPLAKATDFTSTGINDNATSTAITIDSSERVGIQTTNPVSELDVYGKSRAESFQLHKGTTSLIGATISLTNQSGDANSNDLTITAGQSTNSIALRSSIAVDNFTYSNSAYRRRLRIAQNGDVSFYEDTGTTAKMFWDASAERLGIGITSPSSQLHIYNATNNNDTRLAITGSTTSASDDMLGLLIDNGRHGAGSKIRLGAETTGGVQRDFDIINIPDSNLLRLDGNTEINGGSSSGTLRIRDFGGASERTVGKIQFIGEFTSNPADGNRVFAQIEGQKENGTSGGTDGRLVFKTNSGVSSAGQPVEVGRFDSNGAFIVGGTSSSINNIGAKMTSSGGFQATKSSSAPLSLNRISTDGDIAEFRHIGTVVGSISVTSSATSYNTTSDKRLKDNIQTITDGTEKVMAMNAVTHTWKNKPDTKPVHGFIAQEMQQIIPEAVNGNPDSEEMMSMDYGRITPLLVASLQDAHKKIKELENKINSMENK